MGDIGAKVAADNAVPGGAEFIHLILEQNSTKNCLPVFFVEFLFDVSCNVLFDVVFLECLSGAFDGIGLHILGHVRILDNGLAIGHCGCVYLEKKGLNLSFGCF